MDIEDITSLFPDHPRRDLAWQTQVDTVTKRAAALIGVAQATMTSAHALWKKGFAFTVTTKNDLNTIIVFNGCQRVSISPSPHKDNEVMVCHFGFPLVVVPTEKDITYRPIPERTSDTREWALALTREVMAEFAALI